MNDNRKNKRLLLLEVFFIILCLVLIVLFGPSFGVLTLCAVCLMLVIVRRIDWRKHFIMKRVLVVSVLIGALSFVIVECLILSELRSNDAEVHDVDYVVVLGAGLRGTEPSLLLRLRLEAALDYLKNNVEVPVIVSGGQGPGEFIPEAVAMSTYFISNGIDENRIILESESTSTEENIRFSDRLMKQQGIINPKVMIVTSDFHMYRAKLLAKRMDWTPYGISSESPLYLNVNYLIREYFAFVKTLL